MKKFKRYIARRRWLEARVMDGHAYCTHHDEVLDLRTFKRKKCYRGNRDKQQCPYMEIR